MFESFGKSARVCFALAYEEAREMSSRRIAPSHLLLGVVLAAEGPLQRVFGDADLTADGMRAAIAAGDSADGDDLDGEALASIGIDLDSIRRKVEEQFGVGALDAPQSERKRKTSSRPHRGRHGVDRPAKQVLDVALRDAGRRGSSTMELEHLTLALITTGGPQVDALLGSIPAARLRLDVEALLERAA